MSPVQVEAEILSTIKGVPSVSRRLWIIASAIVWPVCAWLPFAVAAGEGKPLKGGARNPSTNASQAYTKETEIIANNSTYGTRQSNKSDNGGGAIYGCRSGAGGSAKGNEPCIRANNLANGLAFEFERRRRRRAARSPSATAATRTKPFTTNATGVATGLNADQRRRQETRRTSSPTRRRQNRFAQSSQARRAGHRARRRQRHDTSRPAPTTSRSTSDISKCAYNATEASDRRLRAPRRAAATPRRCGVRTRRRGGQRRPPTAPFHLAAHLLTERGDAVRGFRFRRRSQAQDRATAHARPAVARRAAGPVRDAAVRGGRAGR